MNNKGEKKAERWGTIETDSKGKAKMDDMTMCISFIRHDFVLDCLRSIHEHVKSISFKIVCVNQTQSDREFEDALYELCDVVIRPHVNWGFGQSMNVAMRIASTPYICACNDDVLFINDPFPGIFETFDRFETAAAVCPQSVKEPGWGWGEPGYRYLIPEKYDAPYAKKLYEKDRKLMGIVKEAKNQWETERSDAARSALETARENYRATQEELDELVPELARDSVYVQALIKEKNWAVVDGFAMFMPVFRADMLAEIGMFDEAFNAGGEDYDWLCRSAQAGYRNLSTSRAIVHHYWGQTKDHPDGFKTALPRARPPWNCLSTKGFGDRGKWSPDVAIWGDDWAVRTDEIVYQAPL